MPHIYFFRYFSDLGLFFIPDVILCLCPLDFTCGGLTAAAVAAEAVAHTHTWRGGHMWAAADGGGGAERRHGADLCRLQWSRGVRASAAGCRRRQECQEQGACECAV